MDGLRLLEMIRSKRPPIMVILLCAVYCATASRGLIGLVPIGSGLYRHGVVHTHHLVSEVVLVLLSSVVAFASLATIVGNRIARLWLTVALVSLVPLVVALGVYDDFHEHQYASPGPVSLLWIINSIKWQVYFLREIVPASLAVLGAHYWFLYRTRSAKAYFDSVCDA